MPWIDSVLGNWDIRRHGPGGGQGESPLVPGSIRLCRRLEVVYGGYCLRCFVARLRDGGEGIIKEGGRRLFFWIYSDPKPLVYPPGRGSTDLFVRPSSALNYEGGSAWLITSYLLQ